MSIFDPHALYYHPEKKTHKGQIIQKKPTNLQHAISKSEIPRSISVLKSYGYDVYPPGESIKTTIYSDTICKTYVFNVNINAREYTRSFNTVWNDISLDFANILNERNIVSFEMSLNIPSMLIYSNGGPGSQFTLDTEKLDGYTFSVGSSGVWTLIFNSYTTNGTTFIQYNSAAGYVRNTVQYTNPDQSGLFINVNTDDTDVYQQLSTQGYLTDDVVLFILTNSGSNINSCNYTLNVQFTISYISEVIPVN